MGAAIGNLLKFIGAAVVGIVLIVLASMALNPPTSVPSLSDQAQGERFTAFVQKTSNQPASTWNGLGNEDRVLFTRAFVLVINREIHQDGSPVASRSDQNKLAQLIEVCMNSKWDTFRGRVVDMAGECMARISG